MSDAAPAGAAPRWLAVTILGAAGLLYAYAVWNAVAFLVEHSSAGLSGYGWFVLVFAILFPLIAFAVVYAIGNRRPALERFVALAPSPLETRERLEQLRALEDGMRIDVTLVDTVPVEVNTPADLDLAFDSSKPASSAAPKSPAATTSIRRRCSRSCARRPEPRHRRCISCSARRSGEWSVMSDE